MAKGRYRIPPGRGIVPGAVIALWMLLLLPAGPAQGQQYNIHHYNVRDGLPQTQVVVVHQDPAGYLWLGTYGGLSRYNGHSFTNFTTADGLSSNLVEALASDKDGRLWIGTGAGLCRQKAEGGFFCFDQAPLATAYVYELYADKAGIWAATDAGLFRITDASMQRFGKEHGLRDDNVRSLARDTSGGLWVGTTSGLGHQAAGADRFDWIAFDPGEGGQVNALYSSENRLWVGTSVGLFAIGLDRKPAPVALPAGLERADINAIAPCGPAGLCFATGRGVLVWQQNKFSLLTARNGLRDEIVYSTFTDREGLTWFGHDSGLDKWVPGGFSGYRVAHGLLHPFVRTLKEDADGRLWLGTRVGVQIVERRGGAWRFDRSTALTPAQGLAHPRVFCIEFPRPGEALIATDYGLAHWREGHGVLRTYTDADGLPSNRVQALLRDRSGAIWIGTDLGAAKLVGNHITPAPGPILDKAYIYRVQQTEDGRLWFATGNSGLVILAPDGRVTQLGAKAGLADSTLWDIAPDRSGGMWAGSNGDGLFHVSAAGTIRRFGTEQGLADGFVWQILVDDANQVWSYTSRGLYRFDGRAFQHYSEDDGLLHPEGAATASVQTRDGRLWFASVDGLMAFDPDRSYFNRHPPTVVIEHALAEGRPIAEHAKLPYRTPRIEFHYAALSFHAERRVRFRYRLSGLSEAWSDPIAYRPIIFGSLGAGRYVFEVEAVNPDGVRSRAPVRFAFSVLPPWWMSAWVWAAAIVLGAGLIWGLGSLRLRQAAALQRRLEALVRERTRELDESQRRLEAANAHLQAASITDPLTDLRNRRYLSSRISDDVEQVRRLYGGRSENLNRDIMFMVIDLDKFKAINDVHGHSIGDRVLKEYAMIIRRHLRDSDYAVRWGGEEFLVVARHTEASHCRILANRMLAAVRAHVVELDGQSLQCLSSFGIAHFPFVPREPDLLNWDQIIDLADIAVYMAKHLGGDGWVALHSADTARIADAAEFMRRARRNLRGLIEEGCVRVEGSFHDPIAGAAGLRSPSDRV